MNGPYDDTYAIDLRGMRPGLLGTGPQLSVESSDLGLPVGIWPRTLRITGATRTIDFNRTGARYDLESDLLSVDYAGGGFDLTVWND